VPIRIAQYGVKHGHAAGKAQALRGSPDVEFVGVYEPDRALWPRLSAARAFADVPLLRSPEELLGDPSIAALAIEGSNAESLAMAEEAIAAGKHLWYDKSAGDDLPRFERLIARARAARLQVQMGYMFRYHQGFSQIASWTRSGFLGEVFGVRAHMSTWLPVQHDGWTATARTDIMSHRGGIFYDLGGHMLDQLTWLLGRPQRLTAFLRNDATPALPRFADNTLVVAEYARALATIDLTALECRPAARRFEVYGSRGSATMEPFETDPQLRLCLEAPAGDYSAGLQTVPLPPQHRQALYERELLAFVATLRDDIPPDRSLDHELLVQETLLRAVAAGASR
jgi:predicted dehydrogenase